MVQLNQSEREFISKLPQAMQAEAEKTLLASKASAQAEVTARREVFTVSVSETVKDDKGNTKPGKGGIKVTGLGQRFPVTLYPEQWEIIFANQEAIRKCGKDNADLIARLRK